MIGLDTSVIVRLMIGEPSEQAQRARAVLDERMHQGKLPAYVSDLAVGEAYFALRHHYAVPHEATAAALAALLADPRVKASGNARSVLASIIAEGAGAGLMDRLIHADYEYNQNAVMLTFDLLAARLPGATLLEAPVS